MKRILTLLSLLLCGAAFGAAPIIVINQNSLPNGQVGVLYQTQLTASNFTGTVVWSVYQSNLPSGFVLDASFGVICTGTQTNNQATCNGTASTAGTFNFTIQAQDFGGTGGVTQKSFSITILSAGRRS